MSRTDKCAQEGLIIPKTRNGTGTADHTTQNGTDPELKRKTAMFSVEYLVSIEKLVSLEGVPLHSVPGEK